MEELQSSLIDEVTNEEQNYMDIINDIQQADTPDDLQSVADDLNEWADKLRNFAEKIESQL